jgi:hypothetical protein
MNMLSKAYGEHWQQHFTQEWITISHGKELAAALPIRLDN